MQKGKSLKKKEIHPLPFIILIFSMLIVFSAIGLDYIAWKKGDGSYIFSPLLKKRKIAPRQETLDQIVMKNLAFLSIPPQSIQHYKDQKGDLHWMMDLPIEKYAELEFLLHKEFKQANVAILEKEGQLGEEKDYYLWKVESKRDERMILLFSCQKEKVKEVIRYVRKFKNKVAIIVDDMGYSLKAINDICSIKKPLTISIIPFSPLAQETARIAHEHELEVMLHLPLESISRQEHNDIEGLIHSGMSEREIKQMMDAQFEQVPFATGVNNHMGSKITADESIMRIILEFLKQRNLFFVDSRTTSRSIGYKVARTFGVPSAYRHVFLDSEHDENYIKRKLMELFRLAQKNGEAVGICHPTEETLKVLKENFHLVDQFNLDPVFVSQIVR